MRPSHQRPGHTWKTGDIVVRRRGKLEARVVLYLGESCVAFRKIRESWTRRPAAWYDRTDAAIGGFRRTGRRARLSSAEKAEIRRILEARYAARRVVGPDGQPRSRAAGARVR